jgi:hypothetical protein
MAGISLKPHLARRRKAARQPDGGSGWSSSADRLGLRPGANLRIYPGAPPRLREAPCSRFGFFLVIVRQAPSDQPKVAPPPGSGSTATKSSSPVQVRHRRVQVGAGDDVGAGRRNCCACAALNLDAEQLSNEVAHPPSATVITKDASTEEVDSPRRQLGG